MKHFVFTTLIFTCVVGCSAEKEEEIPQPVNTIHHIVPSSPLSICVTDVFDNHTLPPGSNFRDTIEVDFDDDSIADLRFNVISTYTFGKHCTQDTFLSYLNNGIWLYTMHAHIEVSFGDSLINYGANGIRIVNQQKPINNIIERYWDKGLTQLAKNVQSIGYTCSEWDSKGPLVLCRIDIDNHYQYGWFRYGDGCESDEYGIQIKEYAFETKEGELIYPGQTTR